MKNILFLCTGNSCRSQMAEGWAKLLKSEKYNFYSAGTKEHGLNPRAVTVMREVGVDISGQKSKTINDLPETNMDYIVTLCSDADETCPHFAGGKVFHHGFDDPPKITADFDDEEEILNIYRRVRDEIKDFVNNIEEMEP